MPACFTSSTRIGASIGLAALALVTLDAAAQPRGVACPARLGGMPLSTVDVFDGPPAELAILKPDISRRRRTGWVSTWDVSYIHRTGRRIYLQCIYGGISLAVPGTKSVVLPVPRAKLCRWTERGKFKSMSCV